MMRAQSLAILLIVIPIFSYAGCGDGNVSQTEFRATWRLATVAPKTHPYTLGSLKFAELVKERSNGRIQIEVYPESQLAKGEREILGAVQQGTIDFYVGATGTVSSFNPTIGLLDMPFLFRDYSHADRILDGKIGHDIMDELETSNFKALAFWENGFRDLTNSRIIVKNPADVNGLNIRTMENPIHIAAWKSLGANPVPMPWGEVAQALKQKIIDGQENPAGVAVAAKFYETQQFLSLTHHAYSAVLLIINLDKWKIIPTQDKQMLLTTAAEVAKYQRNLGREAEQGQIAELAAKGMTVTADVDRAAWKKAMEPVIEKYSKHFSAEKIAAIQNTR